MSEEAMPDWLRQARSLIGKRYGRVRAWDPVNVPMARQWAEIMGVTNPVYSDASRAQALHGRAVVPPAMLQVWCMEGPVMNHYAPGSTDENPYEVLKMMEAQGYGSVVAVNSELSFDRYLSPDEQVYYVTDLQDIGPEKTTALGTGFFVTLIMTYYVEATVGDPDESQDERVGQLLFRVFKFKPAAPPSKSVDSAASGVQLPKVPAPGISDDTRFFWDGASRGQLMVQRCTSCQTLRHPPGPACPQCHSLEWDTLEASGKGTLYSYVVMHYPEVPPFSYPNPIGLIELEEGTRLIAGLKGFDAQQHPIGTPVLVQFETVETTQGPMTFPYFTPTPPVGA
ncbi:MAG: hypothetical protein RL320_1460 [Pseudomonadota bacterium]